MRREGAAVLRKHNVRVAVVGGDDNHAAKLLHLRGDFAEALVHRFAGGNRRGENSGVPHHVGVRKIENYHVVNIPVKLLEQLFRDEIRAHFRLQIVGGDLRRGD